MALHRGDPGEEEPRVGEAMSCDFERRIEDLEEAVRELRDKEEPSLETKYAIREMQEAREENERLKHQLQEEKQARIYEREGLGKMEKTIKHQRAEIELLRSVFKANTLVKGIKAVRELIDDTDGVFHVTDGIVFKNLWTDDDTKDDLRFFFAAEAQIAQSEKVDPAKFLDGGFVAGQAPYRPIFPDLRSKPEGV